MEAEDSTGIGKPVEWAHPAPAMRMFQSVEELWDALEVYAKYHDGIVRRGAGCGRAHNEQDLQISPDSILEANRSIDRAMARLAKVNPSLYVLLDGYYRGGLCFYSGGWIAAAARAGLVLSKKDRGGKLAFDWILEQAVELLFVLHRARREWRRSS